MMCRLPRQFEQSLGLAPGSRACQRLAAPENLQAFGASIAHRLKLSDLEAKRLRKTDDAPGQLRTTNREICLAFQSVHKLVAGEAPIDRLTRQRC